MPHILIFSISLPFGCPFMIQDCFRLVPRSCSIDYVFLLHTVCESSQLWLNSKILCVKNFQNITQCLDILLVEECFFFCNYFVFFFNFFLSHAFPPLHSFPLLHSSQAPYLSSPPTLLFRKEQTTHINQTTSIKHSTTSYNNTKH